MCVWNQSFAVLIPCLGAYYSGSWVFLHFCIYDLKVRNEQTQLVEEQH